jgi:hypothetical protein
MPEMEVSGTREISVDAQGRPVTEDILRLSPEFVPHDICWPDPGYATAYRNSYDIFAGLQRTGAIPGDVRFQVEYPTPVAVVTSAFVPQEWSRLTPSYAKVLHEDLARALGAIPHDRVAVQWDVCFEFWLLQGRYGPPPEIGEIAATLASNVDLVPGDVPVGMHLCYGDAGHRHYRDPESLALQVQIVNSVIRAASRPIDWFSFTVTQDAREAAFFAPIASLEATQETELYFSLVPYHPAQQAPGTTSAQVMHIDHYLAQAAAGPREWGICAECGLGRVDDEEEIKALLDQHSRILDTYGVT